MRTTRRRQLISAAVALGCLAAAAGCSSNTKADTATADTATASTSTSTTAKPVRKLKVAVVTPSAADDHAFSQPMIEALQLIAKERGGEFMELETTTQMFQTEKARQAILDYAAGGADIIVAHSDAFGPLVKEIAAMYPSISFVWGTEVDTFGLPNVYSYGIAANEGAYVLGVEASQLTKSDKVGVIGPIESGDAKLFVDGFAKGVADTKASVKTEVTYINSFSDVVKAGTAAKTFTDGGADVLTGSSEAMAGALPVVVGAGATWFGNQSSHIPLSPEAVAASQVYHFEDTLRDVVANVEAGTLGGKEYTLTLANHGLVIEYNPAYKMPAAARAKGDAAEKSIISGALNPGV